MSDLVGFLRARFDETDEQCCGASEYEDCLYKSELRHREIEANRRIVHELSTVTEWSWPSQSDGSVPMEYVEALRHVLKMLALPYANHPDYDAAWRL